jgi:hypothetical protein
VSYEVNVPGAGANNYTCGILNEKYEKNRATKMNYNSEKLTLICTSGNLGSNCEISCKDILGDEYEYCQALHSKNIWTVKIKIVVLRLVKSLVIFILPGRYL